jgi:spermidine synthase
MLEREPVQKFDLLVMDAFSGGSVPTHLVTLEAIRTYLGQMNEGGLLAFNITNRFLDLRPVMAAAASRSPTRRSRPGRRTSAGARTGC